MPQLLPVPLLSLRVPAHAQTRPADHRINAFTSVSSAIDAAQSKRERMKVHLADAFIQSDLQLHPGYTFSLVCVFPGNRTHNPLRHWRNALPLSHTGKYIVSSYSKHTGSPLNIPLHNDLCSIHQRLDLSTHANIDSVYTRVPQIFPWRANLLQSLAPTLFKLTYLWFSNDLEDSD